MQMEHKTSLARSDLERILVDETAEPKALPLSLFEDIAGGFSADREIGRGGFAVVYKGILGSRVVAVKKLSMAGLDEIKFLRELECLLRVKHKNTVRCLGYCADTQGNMQKENGKFIMAGVHHQLLCFEYISKGSLDKYIADASSGINWHKRWKVIEGISYGLQYLHEYSNEPIIHLDLKPANILLDTNMLPKIADFGLSRIFGQNKTIHTANTTGTFGYMPKETLLKGIITPKSDIFSLGVIIMEVITGHRDYPDNIESSKCFLEQELEKWRHRLQEEPGYTSLDKDCQQIERCLQIGLICVNDDRTKRPTMKKIIDMLQGLESTDWYIGNKENATAKRLYDEEQLKESRDAEQLEETSPLFSLEVAVAELDASESAIGLGVPENAMAMLLYDETGLIIEKYNSGLAFYKMNKTELLKTSYVSDITLSDLEKLNNLRSIHFERCDTMFSAELCDGVFLHSVQVLHIKELEIRGELFSEVLRCFPALSQLTVTKCKNLELLPVEDGGLSGLMNLQSFTGCECKKLFSRWGVVGGGAGAIKPFPASLKELDISFESSMQSMGLLSNLTSLTSLSLTYCSREITMDGFNPLIIVNLKKLCVWYPPKWCVWYEPSDEDDMPIAGNLLSEIASAKLLHAGSFQLEELQVDSISAVLTGPICSHLSATLHTLQFICDQRAAAFTEEQEQALQLLTSLQYLQFYYCENLQSLPQGLDGLSSLKRLKISSCEKIRSLPRKEGFPISLENLEVWYCSPKVTKQAKKLKRANPWLSVDVRVFSETWSWPSWMTSWGWRY